MAVKRVTTCSGPAWQRIDPALYGCRKPRRHAQLLLADLELTDTEVALYDTQRLVLTTWYQCSRLSVELTILVELVSSVNYCGFKLH
ncbi:hypothetical protein BaRGS_00028483 [Batillaria attramentaria]|uniref:Uncharacterized protein n=1 Tax=Batillaria attramentaria TaxID=370345 RepID=A0ABD0JZZ5_9CAEN